MFGLLELSRQRLRSSLIDRSFEKCPYCNGSGLILNSKSISDQIIKVINEKLSAGKKIILQVKCNSALAENLMNEKRTEINLLETKYASKIAFIFDNHYSLHEPTIEIVKEKDSGNQINIERKENTKKITKKTKKKSTKKQSASSSSSKKENNIKQPKKKVLNEVKNDKIKTSNANKEIKNEIDKNISSKENKDLSNLENNEKSGWWSE